ncbi:methylase [Mangrovimonas yunxiaonensis]|uniref:site-specific DNA-methyltransferase (adenine-specific) n=1 Tax=Mangrovimonas yunxiaonensis TaxID=1197477 RepID=A0A084TK46_9FLAO|nr:DNA methyltransferase [Mangrovimonas yunxiaonensis]KFB01082.1 methylase [Mangrovimonas yunxiaonensis]GGH48246.1 methylase [Mangrovimonas yunxiaonensis]
MALSWNEIKDRALKFTKEWQGESRERAEKDTFWNDFFNVFGISRRRLATFEEPVKKLNNKQGFIDLFWKGTLLVEHKSKGKNLDAAFEQATDYFHGIKEHELPKYVLVSDFENFKLYDLDDKKEYEFGIKDFHKNIKLFGFIAGYQKRTFKDEDPVNIKAAELMGKLHDQLEESGYEGHPLEVFLVRLLFCLFADDTGIFEKDTFKEFIEVKTNEDGSDIGAWLAQYFQVLNTPTAKRLKNLDEHLAAFPYVNGKLFEEPLPIASFNSRMREILLECSSLDWGKISPAIFGSMFQSVMNPEERRNLGAHYTSEKNILKLIKPLFLDELQAEFQKAKSNKNKLKEFHQKLGSLKFLDPACGCGNFLIITYRELRLLELEVLKELYGGQQVFGIDQIMLVDVDQFYGIEYDEFPARIAEVALWLMDHQMNLRISEAFGMYYARLPLKKSATIVHGNALRSEWTEIIPKSELSYILGNPPFYGSKNQNKEQKEDMKNVFGSLKGSGVLDYVTAWYLRAAQLIQSSKIECAFVSTNSITQGEQVAVLWNELLNRYSIKINFAHRTFNWKNEAKGNAAVHVVIIGFAIFDKKPKRLFEYSDIKGEPHEVKAKNINPYLVDASNSVAISRSKPLCSVQEVIRGSETTDSGNFMLSEEEKNELLKNYPQSESFVRTFQGGGDIINNRKRYCLWLRDVSPAAYRNIPLVMEKVQAVKDFRLSSKKERTRKWAEFPTLFSEDRQPENDFLVIPKVSSERRKYVPIAYLPSSVIINNTASALPNANLWYFGIITSLMHMTWLKYTCGRMKSDYIYSIQIVYNNYPWPKEPSDKNKKAVETKAQKVLDVRAEFPESSLADLYDPLTMPPKLVKAHQELDKAVDLCYRPQAFTNETARIEFLFDLYNEYTMPLLKKEKKTKKK